MNLLRIAALLQLVGFVLAAAAFLKFGALSFFLFSILGVPLIFAGMGLYIAFVLRTLAKKGAL